MFVESRCSALHPATSRGNQNYSWWSYIGNLSPVLMFTFPLSLVMALHLDKLKSESFQVVFCKPEWLLAKTFSCNLSLVAIPKQIEIDMFPGRYRWYSPHNCRMVPPSDVCWFITPMNIIVISPIIYFNWTLLNGGPILCRFPNVLSILGLLYINPIHLRSIDQLKDVTSFMLFTWITCIITMTCLPMKVASQNPSGKSHAPCTYHPLKKAQICWAWLPQSDMWVQCSTASDNLT
jgi:hypothetical protein